MFHQINPKAMARRLMSLSSNMLTYAQALEEAAQLLGFASYRAYKAIAEQGTPVLYGATLEDPDAPHSESSYQLTVMQDSHGLTLALRPVTAIDGELAGRPALYLQVAVKAGLPCVGLANQPDEAPVQVYGHGQGLVAQSRNWQCSWKTGVPSQSELAETVREASFQGQPVAFIEMANGIRPGVCQPLASDELAVPVVTAPGQSGVWSILENLTSRDGELNGYRKAHTAAYRWLESDEALLAQCHQMMWDEITFVAQKDGALGMLFEVEYLSQESEEGSDPEAPTYEPHAVLVARLAARVQELGSRFPGIAFAVNPGHNTVNGRAVMWAFVPLTVATPALSEELGKEMLDIAYGT